MLDVRAWLIWSLTVLVMVSSTRNPLYVVLLLLMVTITSTVCAPDREQRGLPSTLRFGLFAVPLAALFNGLTIHSGATPLIHLPEWVPLAGGPITLEALAFGATNGLVLTAIFGGFAVFNTVTPTHDLVRLTPRAFREAGVVASIALTFIPQTSRSLKRIREAQAVRGHQVRGLRDWLPIVVPLLVSGLERSMGLAEAMVARGYGAIASRANPLRRQILLALGLMGLLGGWLSWLFLPEWRTAATAGMALGGLLILGAIWLAGRHVERTHYREYRWTWRDTLVAAGCIVNLVVALLPLPLVDGTTFGYTPYPHLTVPAFDPLIGIALLGLLLPVVIALLGEQE
jgi:energy-coupling factor transport system permease protein